MLEGGVSSIVELSQNLLAIGVRASGSLNLIIWNYHDDTYPAEFDENNLGHNNWVNALLLIKDGSLLASASNDCLVKIWNVSPIVSFNSDCVGHGTNTPISNLILLDNDLFASADAQGQIFIWEIGTKCQKVFGPLKDTSFKINSLAYLGGGFLASGDDNNRINIWNINDGSFVSSYSHINKVLSLASLNNGFLVGGSLGGSTTDLGNLKLWKVF
jgi:WD40 repeat protein